MLIVDAQVHIWSQGTPSGQHRQISSYTAEDCLKEMGEGGVAAAVLHPPRWDPNDVEFAAEAAHQYPKSRPSRNQTGISNALHPQPYGLFLDDLPIHIRPNLPAARVQT